MSIVKIGKDILETVEETDLSTVSEADAKELLKLVMWFFASRYREPGDTRPKHFSGLLPAQVKQRVETEYVGLLKAAGFEQGTMSAPTVLSYITKGGRWFWDSMDRLRWLKFIENQELLDEGKKEAAEIMRDPDASRGIRLAAIRAMTDVTAAQGRDVGYSTQRMVVIPGSVDDDNVFGSADKERMLRAKSFTDEYEQSLLGDGSDNGEIEP